MPRSLPGGNHPDHFFAIFLEIDMRNQNHGDAARHTQSLPSLLAVYDPVDTTKAMGIFKYQRCSLKAEPMLAEILTAFLFISTKAHARNH